MFSIALRWGRSASWVTTEANTRTFQYSVLGPPDIPFLLKLDAEITFLELKVANQVACS
jgi:hypothetical protein